MAEDNRGGALRQAQGDSRGCPRVNRVRIQVHSSGRIAAKLALNADMGTPEWQGSSSGGGNSVDILQILQKSFADNRNYFYICSKQTVVESAGNETRSIMAIPLREPLPSPVILDLFREMCIPTTWNTSTLHYL